MEADGRFDPETVAKWVGEGVVDALLQLGLLNAYVREGVESRKGHEREMIAEIEADKAERKGRGK